MTEATDASSVSIARAHGRGAGRFAAATLGDALRGGMRLDQVRPAIAAVAGSSAGLDFVLSDPTAVTTSVVVRIGVNATGRIVGTELLHEPRTEKATEADWGLSGGVRSLAAGDTLETLRWTTDGSRVTSIELTLRGRHSIVRHRP